MMRITLKAARVNKNLTQKQVAEELGVTRDTVCRWETGKTKPDIGKVGPLCTLYGVTYDDIVWCN